MAVLFTKVLLLALIMATSGSKNHMEGPSETNENIQLLIRVLQRLDELELENKELQHQIRNESRQQLDDFRTEVRGQHDEIRNAAQTNRGDVIMEIQRHHDEVRMEVGVQHEELRNESRARLDEMENKLVERLDAIQAKMTECCAEVTTPSTPRENTTTTSRPTERPTTNATTTERPTTIATTTGRPTTKATTTARHATNATTTERPTTTITPTESSREIFFLRREDGSIDFYRNWAEYQVGFGNGAGEFWLGLDSLHTLTTGYNYRLRVDLTDWTGETRWAEYSTFRVAGEGDGYRLTVRGYQPASTAGDSMALHSGKKFSAYDRDNDSWFGNCAEYHKGGWWYKQCVASNPTGVYQPAGYRGMDAVVWWYAHFDWRSFKVVTMKLVKT